MGFSGISILGHKRTRGDQDDGDIILLRSGLGLGDSLGFVQAHVSRFARFQLACSCMQV